MGTAAGFRSYSFTDEEAVKSGPRYYRLKVINTDGSFTYSPVRSAVFDELALWQVYPNPSTGLFNLVYQLNNNDGIFARIIDGKGSVVKEYRQTANGFLQKLNIDLATKPTGVYLLEISAAGSKRTFKLYKQ